MNVQRLLECIGLRRRPAGGAPLPAAPLAPDWTDDHRRAFLAFLKTEAGVVLMARMNAVAAHNAATACLDPMHTQHSAGRAAGFGDARNWLLSLSRVSRDLETTDMQADPEGEAALHERFSP